jgi:hypothetical protein
MITCKHCKKENIIRADNELIEAFSSAEVVLCQNNDCQEAYPLNLEEGLIRSFHHFGDFWSVDKKSITEELQSV